MLSVRCRGRSARRVSARCITKTRRPRLSRVESVNSRCPEGITTARPVTSVFFPLDEQLELWEHHWSESVVKYAVWLSGLVTFAEAATILNTIGEIPISASSIWRRVAIWGPQCQALEALQRAASAAAPTREELNYAEALLRPDLGAAMDGGMVHIRDEGWKELRTGPPPLRGGHGQSRLHLCY